MTDLLINMLKTAEAGGDFRADMAALRAKHVATADTLLSQGTREHTAFVSHLDREMEGIVAILSAVTVAGMRVGAFEDFVIGHGEVWSARMTALRLQQMGVDAEFMDAREVMVVKPR